MNKQIRELVAEFLGTFTLVFIGMGSVIVASTAEFNANVIVPALGHGLILVGLIYAFGHISGAHFNPAVTVALLVGRKINLQKAVLYIVTQFVAGIVAAFLMAAIIPGLLVYGETVGALTDEYVWNAALMEVVLTFFLASAVFQAAVYNKAGNLAGVAIGFTLAASILAGGPFTGASLNPARTLGPALAAGHLDYVIPYLVGIFGGGALAGVVHGWLLTES
ncbi:MAG: aquaporin [Anaerolineae bacterium]|nr:aquaporin [Anaerolineae bacterium]